MASVRPLDAVPTLSALRSEIDGIDDALLGLIEARVAASAAVAALKAGEGSDRLRLRPRREAEVVARVTAHARAAPPEMIAHLWRTLMSYGLQAQGPMRLVVCADGNRPMLQERVRARFGPAADLDWVEDAETALAAARTQEAVAIVRGPVALRQAGETLRLFDTIVVADGEPLHAIGRVAAEDVVGKRA